MIGRISNKPLTMTVWLTIPSKYDFTSQSTGLFWMVIFSPINRVSLDHFRTPSQTPLSHVHWMVTSSHTGYRRGGCGGWGGWGGWGRVGWEDTTHVWHLLCKNLCILMCMMYVCGIDEADVDDVDEANGDEVDEDYVCDVCDVDMDEYRGCMWSRCRWCRLCKGCKGYRRDVGEM